ncbi:MULTISPECIES: inositol-3-phosphate synthase [Haloferax]|uniref:Inositol-3-phosphate synthase n=3 Tax=Haloferax TaxID=2251 RepID=A0ACD5I2M0_9EURY|nr:MULTISPECIES: inositol-3-phosphate synthase [Haloferax]MBC9988073.1 myo-inositol-1-phosphate synthase [Haloferax sp. AS1]NLV03072.1 myo-inositol-1-phosphate synthase [Haloferax alexandrinus]RDZ30865.1 myo-inositol-1-phosphate synthase [Haloferax sp. Atlit-48N]RDZ33871.1 myo-inositol-1-phosphate synthase [Haloferax sp. Atlit-24N]RDZ38503.1 myo-inositol-1-phosphate synthase [Haloferax sp. Atlit-47N]
MTVGVWIIGARGNVASVSMTGARAIARGVADTTGMVTAREPVAALDLPAVDDLVFGGHDIRSQRIEETAEEMAGHGGVVAPDTLDAVREDLREIDERVELGTARRCGEAVEGMSSETTGEDVSVADIVEEIRADYAAFADSQGVDRLVVVNAASTEPPIPTPGDYDTLAAFETAVERDDPNLPASALYAYAALLDGHPYVNFTPSTGSSLGGLRELAERNEVPHMGRDGKTGETLMKSALGPMFAGRNLRVLSWEGHNILGNSDGLVLEDDANKAGKIESKGSLLDDILGYETHNAVRIDYTPSLGDWKTAWDHVHFEGFLGTEMKMQFTWEGADSALAAPLVLDLVRLAAFADERGEGGTMSHLASFFKSPEGVDRHELSEQFRLLYDYAERHAEGA